MDFGARGLRFVRSRPREVRQHASNAEDTEEEPPQQSLGSQHIHWIGRTDALLTEYFETDAKAGPDRADEQWRKYSEARAERDRIKDMIAEAEKLKIVEKTPPSVVNPTDRALANAEMRRTRIEQQACKRMEVIADRLAADLAAAYHGWKVCEESLDQMRKQRDDLRKQLDSKVSTAAGMPEKGTTSNNAAKIPMEDGEDLQKEGIQGVRSVAEIAVTTSTPSLEKERQVGQALRDQKSQNANGGTAVAEPKLSADSIKAIVTALATVASPAAIEGAAASLRAAETSGGKQETPSTSKDKPAPLR